MRNSFRIMAQQGATPLEFGLKVRTNPNLIITSKTKMKVHVKKEPHSPEVEEIITFEKNNEVIKSNFEATNKFLLDIDKPTISGEFDNSLQKWKNAYIWKDVDPKNVINFLKSYRKFEDSRTLGCKVCGLY